MPATSCLPKACVSTDKIHAGAVFCKHYFLSILFTYHPSYRVINHGGKGAVASWELANEGHNESKMEVIATRYPPRMQFERNTFFNSRIQNRKRREETRQSRRYKTSLICSKESAHPKHKTTEAESKCASRSFWGRRVWHTRLWALAPEGNSKWGQPQRLLNGH